MNDIDNTVNRAQKLSRRYMELVSKDIQENINSLYDGPFQTSSITQQRGQGGGAAQGTVCYWMVSLCLWNAVLY